MDEAELKQAIANGIVQILRNSCGGSGTGEWVIQEGDKELCFEVSHNKDDASILIVSVGQVSQDWEELSFRVAIDLIDKVVIERIEP